VNIVEIYIQKDKTNDQIYLGFLGRTSLRRGAVKKTVRVTDSISLDYDGKKRLVGIDIANASKVLGRSAFSNGLVGAELVGVAEAAKLCGVRKPNFLRDFVAQPDFPKPIVDLASGRVWRKPDIEAFLDNKSRVDRPVKSPTRQAAFANSLVIALADDELAFRHSAITYFIRSYAEHLNAQAPTIDEIARASVEEDAQMTQLAQEGDVGTYVEAAYALFDKYSPALKSYLVSLIKSADSSRVKELSKTIWVEALKQVQRGEYQPGRQGTFSAWLAHLAAGTMRSAGTATPARVTTTEPTDPLGAAIRAERYEQALEEHERRLRRLQTERYVLEYLEHLSADEIVEFAHTSKGRTLSREEVRRGQRRARLRLVTLSQTAD
jgi:hypothetical protein